MTQALRNIVTAVTKVNMVVGKAASYTLIALTLLVFFEIIMRYFLNSPSVWGYDMSLWLYGMPALLAGGYVLANKGHANMDVLYTKLTPRKRAILDLITCFMFFAFTGVLLYQGLRFANFAITGNEMAIGAWKVPVWPVKIFVPIAAALIFAQGIAGFIQNAYMAFTGKELIRK